VSRILAAFRNQKYQDPVANIEKGVSDWVRKNDLEKLIAVTRDKDGSIKVEIRDQVFFQSGQFRLHARGKRTLASLSDSLGRIPPPYRLGIEGHTDDTPVRSRTIEDNFDLSGRRALAVFHALSLPDSMRRRTVLMAHGPNQPVVPNRARDGTPLPENQTQNRRVTLRIF
jgi:chemotaxis protein MotB